MAKSKSMNFRGRRMRRADVKTVVRLNQAMQAYLKAGFQENPTRSIHYRIGNF